MLLKLEEMSWLEPDGKDQFKAVDGLSPEQKEILMGYDEAHLETQGKHLITNYKELKK